LAERAAWLAKADLLTGMVGEFPELQGVMGRYYALHDGEPAAVADAIESHYRPRFAGDKLPEGAVACVVALADKFDAMAGLFSIGQQPTGDKDPFGLRRAALGVVRILVEHKLHLSLKELIHAAFEPFAAKPHTQLRDFLFDRFGSYLKEQGYSTLQVEAVLSKMPVNLGVVPLQLEAVKVFQALPEAESLAAANKRVANILRQAESKGSSFASVHANRADLKEKEEIALFDVLESTANRANAEYEKGNYTGFLKSFAVMKQPVDAFFDKIMVMTDDDRLRNNRLALLSDLRSAMNRVADISKLAS
jgi:glycyl-tRNA synthetase beta chain